MCVGCAWSCTWSGHQLCFGFCALVLPLIHLGLVIHLVNYLGYVLVLHLSEHHWIILIPLLVNPFITTHWATWSEKHQTVNKWTSSCWPILWCFVVKAGWQANATMLHANRYNVQATCYMLTGTCYLRRKFSPCGKSWRNEKLQCRCLIPSSFILSFNIAIMAFTISFHKTPF